MGAAFSRKRKKKRNGVTRGQNPDEDDNIYQTNLSDSSLNKKDVQPSNNEAGYQCHLRVNCAEENSSNVAIQPRCNSATVPKAIVVSAQNLRRSLPPLPFSASIASDHYKHKSVQVEVGDFPVSGNVDVKSNSLHNGCPVLSPNASEVVDMPLQSRKEECVFKEREMQSSCRSQEAAANTRYENSELVEINKANMEYKNLKLIRKCDTPGSTDATYMLIDSSSPTKASNCDLGGNRTNKDSNDDENIVTYGPLIGNDSNVGGTERNEQNVNKEENDYSENVYVINGQDEEQSEKVSPYIEACLTQNELPKKENCGHVEKHKGLAIAHPLTIANNSSAFRSTGNVAIDRLNVSNPSVQIPRFPSSNGISMSQWLSNSDLKHMRVFIFLKAEYDAAMVCTVRLCVLLGLAEPRMKTESLDKQILKHKANKFVKVDSFEVPVCDYNQNSIFTVKVSNDKRNPNADVIEKDMDNHVFDISRFMNDSVVESLFWQQLQLADGLLKQFGATISIQQNDRPEMTFKFLESLQKESMVPSMKYEVERKPDKHAGCKEWIASVEETVVSDDSMPHNFELDLHSDGSAPDRKTDMEAVV